MPVAHARRLLPIATALAALVAPLDAQPQRAVPPGRSLEVAGLTRAGFEDLRVSTGERVDGVHRVRLETKTSAWHPWGESGPGLRAHTFGAPNGGPTVPGPLIRVSAGTPVQVTVRNNFDGTLLVRGLRDRGPGVGLINPLVGDSVVVAPGAEVDIRFTPTFAGTYGYFGRVLPPGWTAARPPGPPSPEDRALFGVLIVDPAGEPPHPDERVFVIHHWMDRRIPGTWLPTTRFLINGRSWPHTERFTYTQGDTVRWRVFNDTGRDHPMHLHGFYFRVDGVGNHQGETSYAPAERRFAVTEPVGPSQIVRLTWVPTEPGNWIFHCHLMRHMTPLQTSPLNGDGDSHGEHAASGDAMMGGLVLGITVRPKSEHAAHDDAPRRRLALHIGRRPGVFGDEAGYGFVLQDGAPPAPDSVRFPGSPIVLTRGEPSEIVVHNHADVALGVHWHGLELESWADGVPGWSGYPDAIRPAVPPGDSFVVRMTPPRAGTFMYHVHSEPGHQLAQGLSGAFLVLEPGQAWDRETDRLFLLGSLGVGDDPPAAVNGELDPGPLELRAGTAYRLRFMHISPNDDKRVQLLLGDSVQSWRFVAKDGADLPASQARTVPADLTIQVGETYDYVWAPPAPGGYQLRIVTTFDRGVPAFPRRPPPPDTTDIPLRVRP